MKSSSGQLLPKRISCQKSFFEDKCLTKPKLLPFFKSKTIRADYSWRVSSNRISLNTQTWHKQSCGELTASNALQKFSQLYGDINREAIHSLFGFHKQGKQHSLKSIKNRHRQQSNQKLNSYFVRAEPKTEENLLVNSFWLSQLRYRIKNKTLDSKKANYQSIHKPQMKDDYSMSQSDQKVGIFKKNVKLQSLNYQELINLEQYIGKL